MKGFKHKPESKVKMGLNRSGEKHWNYKGYSYKHSKGYIMIHRPEHPRADRRGYVLEHRLIMEKKIGRYLFPTEDVHHKNEVKDDNRIENLELLTHGKHTTLTNTIDMSNRICSICKTKKTYIDRRNNRPLWYNNKKDRKKLICARCYRKLSKISNLNVLESN